MTLTSAIASQHVVDSYSVQIFPSYRKGVYGQDDAIYALLERLGTKHVRAQVADAPEARAFLRRIHDSLGITVHGTAGSFQETVAQNSITRVAVEQYVRAEPDIWYRLAGFNEPQGTRFGPVPSDWADRTLDQQKWIYALGHSMGIGVAGPAFSNGVRTLQQDWIKLGNLGAAAYMDYICIHLYPPGTRPSFLMEERIGYARDGLKAPDKSIDCSEGGYSTGPAVQGGNPVPEDVQATYAPRHLMDWVLRKGFFNQFELLDDPGDTSREGTLGMVDVGGSGTAPSAWRRKPAFGRVRTLLAQCSDPGPDYTPAPLDVTITTAPSDVRYVLTGKRDGTYRLFLWRDLDVWDRKTRTPISVPVTSVQVNTPGKPGVVAWVGGALTSVVL